MCPVQYGYVTFMGCIKKVHDTESFIKRAMEIHGNTYDYSLIDYKRSSKKVKILCPKHGVFQQIPNSHLNGCGCNECGRDKTKQANFIGLDEFINRSKKVHGNKYNYSVTKSYKGIRIKVPIFCHRHGIFKQAPQKHLRGQGCPKCARELKHYNELTTESFIIKAKKIHGEYYDYSMVDYKKSCIKVKIICPKHGLFEQTPNNHIRGMKCIKCANEINADKRRSTTQEFIDKARKIHQSKYDYSKLEYVSSKTKIKIICPIHGAFLQIPTAHLRGQGCPKCGLWSLLNTNIFKKRAIKVHGKKYDYSLVDYLNSRSKIKISCSKHGIFEQTPQSHLKGHGCPICLESQGERKIDLYLKRQKITYKREKSFAGCRNKYKLFFDFYIPSLNVCIEYDGSQHYYPVEYFGGKKVFKETQKSDAIKNKYCLDNEIKLIRISYRHKSVEEIETVLKKELHF
jgi:hypothetical protein